MSKLWRIIEVPEADRRESDLTSSELVGVSVLLAHHSDGDVYERSWRKIQDVVTVALDDD